MILHQSLNRLQGPLESNVGRWLLIFILLVYHQLFHLDSSISFFHPLIFSSFLNIYGRPALQTPCSLQGVHTTQCYTANWMSDECCSLRVRKKGRSPEAFLEERTTQLTIQVSLYRNNESVTNEGLSAGTFCILSRCSFLHTPDLPGSVLSSTG